MQGWSYKKGWSYMPVYAVVVTGSENEAVSQLLRGAVVLYLQSALKFEYMRLRMIRQCKI
jgi:hypothetical protein